MMRAGLLLACLLCAGPLAAQSPPEAAPPQAPAPQAPERPAPAQPRGDRDPDVAPGPSPQERGALDSADVRARLLDDLFGRLAAAASAQEADGIDDAIEAIWVRTGSPTVDLLMAWAAEELRARNRGRARDYLDGALFLAPDFAEAYYRRAQLHFQDRELGKAMADLERVVALEPRHYSALVGIGAILRDLDRPREALAAFRAALAVHPHLAAAKRAVELLAPRVDGRDG